MTTLAKAIRSHRETARNRRAITEALHNAGSPAQRTDLLIALQRSEEMQDA